MKTTNSINEVGVALPQHCSRTSDTSASVACLRLISQRELESVLTHEGIIDYESVERPEDYDGGMTKMSISIAANKLDRIARENLNPLMNERDALVAVMFAAFEFIPNGSIKETAERLLAPHEFSSGSSERPSGGNQRAKKRP